MLDKFKDKTKNLTTTVSLNSQISEQEKKLDSLYKELGTKYYSLYNQYKVPELLDICENINQSNQKIKDLQDQIKKLKGIKKCISCGRDIPYEAVFCPSCGTNAYNKNDNAKDRVCSNCGSELKPEATFCTNCGMKV